MAELYLQVDGASGGGLGIDSVGLKLRGGVVDVEGQMRREPEGAPGWTVMLDGVIDSLRESRQLLGIRPEKVTDYQASEAEYVHELTLATKVHFPVDKALVAVGYPESLTVWVADPPPRMTGPEDQWDFYGSYLFLVEEGDPAPEVPGRAFLSGVSALGAMVQIARPRTDKEVLHELGRESTDHPIDKLIALGAHVSLERQIEVLYQIRYMTDEQGGWSVSDGRVHDLLAYPLAILPATATQLSFQYH